MLGMDGVLAYGDAIIRLLNFKGHDATGEYYVNDAGRQIDILTCSIILRGKNLFNDDTFQNLHTRQNISMILQPKLILNSLKI